MPANYFKIEGEEIKSYATFLSKEIDNTWSKLLYYPEILEGEDKNPKVFTGSKFTQISFKDTEIRNIRFINCIFEKCLFIGGAVIDCEFIDCKFICTNTSKLKIRHCLFDPKSFEDNFDYINDTNIAIGLYHALYKNAIGESQPEYATESLYRMKRAEHFHLKSQKERKKLTYTSYCIKKSLSVIHDFVSGYGLRTMRILRLALIVILTFSVLNFYLKDYIFDDKKVLTFIDSLYFTCVTVTTLGFGDITPITQFGKAFVAFQALMGFVVLSIMLAAIANRTLGSK